MALVLISGYAFGDAHLNEMIFEAASRRERSEFVAFCFGDIPAGLAVTGYVQPLLLNPGGNGDLGPVDPPAAIRGKREEFEKIGQVLADRRPFAFLEDIRQAHAAEVRNHSRGEGGSWHRRLASRIWGRTEWTSRLYKNLKLHCLPGVPLAGVSDRGHYALARQAP